MYGYSTGYITFLSYPVGLTQPHGSGYVLDETQVLCFSCTLTIKPVKMTPSRVPRYSVTWVLGVGTRGKKKYSVYASPGTQISMRKCSSHPSCHGTTAFPMPEVTKMSVGALGGVSARQASFWATFDMEP